MNDSSPEAGRIFFADLGFKERKRVLVVSNDEFNLNATWRKVICVYVTSKHAARGPWIELPSQARYSAANCTEIFTFNKGRLRDRIEPDVTAKELAEVYRGIALALGAEPIYRKLYAG